MGRASPTVTCQVAHPPTGVIISNKVKAECMGSGLLHILLSPAVRPVRLPVRVCWERSTWLHDGTLSAQN